jgi:hypothetical protein
MLAIQLTGCHRTFAPKITYPLPPVAFLPINSEGIRDASNGFEATFCSVFKEFQAQEEYPCEHFIRDSSPNQKPQPSLFADDASLSRYRVILVSGFLSGCLRGTQYNVFGDADKYLLQHHVTLERIPIEGMESVEADSRQIIDYLNVSTKQGDDRPLILVGYSKGAADLEAAIIRIKNETHPALWSRIAALITVAGMIGGSRVYDQLDHPEDVSTLLSHFPFFDCPPGKRDFRSLSRQERQKFLLANWSELAEVPTYSLTTISTPDQTSRVLKPFWDLLTVYGIDEDSQMAQPEQIGPKAVYLGVAQADHWAVALPLEDDPALRTLVNRNHFPRAALIEALLRFVVADLDASKPVPKNP